MRVLGLIVLLSFIAINSFAQKPSMVESEKFYKLINEEDNALILDIRIIDMYKKNRIENALWAGCKDSLFTVLKDVKRQTPLLLYCEIGKRSKECAALLKNRGYRNVFELRGGLKEWIKNGYPVDSIALKD